MLRSASTGFLCPLPDGAKHECPTNRDWPDPAGSNHRRRCPGASAGAQRADWQRAYRSSGVSARRRHQGVYHPERRADPGATRRLVWDGDYRWLAPAESGCWENRQHRWPDARVVDENEFRSHDDPAGGHRTLVHRSSWSAVRHRLAHRDYQRRGNPVRPRRGQRSSLQQPPNQWHQRRHPLSNQLPGCWRSGPVAQITHPQSQPLARRYSHHSWPHPADRRQDQVPWRGKDHLPAASHRGSELEPRRRFPNRAQRWHAHPR